jgi:hypothetical protein
MSYDWIRYVQLHTAGSLPRIAAAIVGPAGIARVSGILLNEGMPVTQGYPTHLSGDLSVFEAAFADKTTDDMNTDPDPRGEFRGTHRVVQIIFCHRSIPANSYTDKLFDYYAMIRNIRTILHGS